MPTTPLQSCARGARMDASTSEDGALVLPRDATRPLTLTVAQVAWVPPREVSGLVRTLDRHREQHGCGHLKRVHQRLKAPFECADKLLAILLCVGEPDALPDDVRQLLTSCGAEPHSVNVPEFAPLTRRQFEEANGVWPVHFHEAAATRSLAAWSEQPTVDELPAMRQHMRTAIAAAKTNLDCGGRGVAAVVVRREGNGESGASSSEVLAVCVDGTRSGGDDRQVAGGGGGWPPPPPLSHPVMQCIEEVARKERSVGAAMRKRRAAAESSSDGADAAAAAAAEAEVDGSSSTVAMQHLCTGCDLYLTHEPCCMCGMALVHSRFKRVIYALPCEGGGALGSRYQLHCEKSLNHHFTVVRGMLQKEAEAALGKAADSCVGDVGG